MTEMGFLDHVACIAAGMSLSAVLTLLFVYLMRGIT